jgi:hypothetical protein
MLCCCYCVAVICICSVIVCVVLCIEIVCTTTLPPGVNPIAVVIYIYSYLDDIPSRSEHFPSHQTFLF